MPCQQRLLSFWAWFLARIKSFAMLTIAQLTCLRLRQKLARTGQPRRKFTIAITVKQGHYLAVWLTMHINLKAFLTSEQGNLRMTLKTDFGKCSLFVFSADGRKDQNMASSFSRQIWRIDWPILLQYSAKAKYWLISRKFSTMKFFRPSVR